MSSNLIAWLVPRQPLVYSSMRIINASMRTDVAQMWVDVATGTGVIHDPVKIMEQVRTALHRYIEEHPESSLESIRVWPIRDGPPVGKPVAIRVEHPDYDEARVIVDQIKERLGAMPGVSDVSDNLQLGNRELVLRVDDDRASELGLIFTDVATAFRGALDGLFVGVFKDTQHDEDLDIKVRYAHEHTQSVDQLPDIDLVSRTTGQSVKLHDVARLEFDQTYTNRYHYDTKRAVEITAAVDNSITDAKIVNEGDHKGIRTTGRRWTISSPSLPEDNSLKLRTASLA